MKDQFILKRLNHTTYSIKLNMTSSYLFFSREQFLDQPQFLQQLWQNKLAFLFFQASAFLFVVNIYILTISGILFALLVIQSSSIVHGLYHSSLALLHYNLIFPMDLHLVLISIVLKTHDRLIKFLSLWLLIKYKFFYQVTLVLWYCSKVAYINNYLRDINCVIVFHNLCTHLHTNHLHKAHLKGIVNYTGIL